MVTFLTARLLICVFHRGGPDFYSRFIGKAYPNIGGTDSNPFVQRIGQVELELERMKTEPDSYKIATWVYETKSSVGTFMRVYEQFSPSRNLDQYKLGTNKKLILECSAAVNHCEEEEAQLNEQCCKALQGSTQAPPIPSVSEYDAHQQPESDAP